MGKRSPFWFRFWGTRGSLPAPRESTNRYGGNTPCVEVRAGDRIIILDAGSGIRELGLLLSREFDPVQATILLSHYHWDHIHGFPFFGPAYHEKNQFDIYGEPRGKRNVKDILAGQMARPYFPIPIDVMKARMDFKAISSGDSVRMGKVVISAHSLNHPGKCLCYRIEHQNKALIYATDTEHGAALDGSLVAFARGAEALIYDSAYTDEEMRNGRKGWGHSTWKEGIKVALAAQVEKLYLFHHEPVRNDRSLRVIELAARRQFKNAMAARERIVYDV